MKNHRKYSFAAGLLLLCMSLLTGVYSCEEKKMSSDGSFSVSVPKTEVGMEKGNQFVSVKAEGGWTLDIEWRSGDPGWAELDATSGTGDKGSVILSYSQNTTGADRSLVLVLSSGKETATCTLVQKSSPGGDVDPDPLPGVPDWLELPAMDQNDGLQFVSHQMKIGTTPTRNYSLYWDKEHLVAHWVAYPLSSWNIGKKVDRTDDWAYDPVVPKNEQPRLAKGMSGYSRGHQIPSADRYESDANNGQTFYYTNMTPQNQQFNGGVWGRLENKVRTIATNNSDTLYVVTGCVVEGSKTKAYDNDGKPITVPVAYFKALLRYQKSSTLGVGGYSAAGYYLKHDSSVNSYSPISIDELEKKTGLDFFVNLKSRIGETNAAAVEATLYDSTVWN